MSLLSYEELIKLVEQGCVENVDPANINGASIDITLDDTVLVECQGSHARIIDLHHKKGIATQEVLMDQWHTMFPGDFLLASSREIFNLPNNIAAEYKLKSSLARCGLNHMLAGWCDPGWTGSKLTLELHNCTRHHRLMLRPGMKIGQMVFWHCNEVDDRFAYGARGQYNGQTKVTASKGLR